MRQSPRTRARMLGRSGKAVPGLFAPLVLEQAAEIEALPLDDFLTDPTKLAKGLTSLHEALGTDAVTVFAGDVTPDASEIRIQTAIEATRRLVTTAPGEPVLVAALTGPATTAAQRGGDWSEASLEAAGGIVLAVAQQFLDAGIHLVLLIEVSVPPATAADAWRSALTPVVNVTRFHQGVPVMVLQAPRSEDCAAVPAIIGLCAPEGTPVPGPPNRVKGVVLPAEPKDWTVPPPGVPLAVTAGAVPGDISFATVLDACRRLGSRS